MSCKLIKIQPLGVCPFLLFLVDDPRGLLLSILAEDDEPPPALAGGCSSNRGLFSMLEFAACNRVSGIGSP